MDITQGFYKVDEFTYESSSDEFNKTLDVGLDIDGNIVIGVTDNYYTIDTIQTVVELIHILGDLANNTFEANIDVEVTVH